MAIRSYDPVLEFVAAEREAELLELLRAHPVALGEFAESLEPELFASCGEEFASWREETGLVSGELAAAARERIAGLVEELGQLADRRRIARMQTELAAQLYGEVDPATIIDGLVAGVRALEAGSWSGRRNSSRNRAALRSAFDWGEQVATTAIERHEQRMKTGKPVTGIPIGLGQLDRLLNGWNPGLHVIAAGPGVGKTTLSLQFAWTAAREGFPALYVSYENAPDNLALKLLCAQTGQSPADVERGYGDGEKMRDVVGEHGETLRRMYFVEGNSRLTLAQVEAMTREISQSHAGRTPLVVFDYLQRAAHGLGYEQLRHNVSAMTAQLRELGQQSRAAVIAISSLNRASGDYGRGGAAQLDSLKESGDLEYGADTVLLLYPPAEGRATPPARDVEVKIAKNRFGPVGTVRLIFRPDTGVFREST